MIREFLLRLLQRPMKSLSEDASVTFKNSVEDYLRSVNQGMWEYSDLAIYVANKLPGLEGAWACITFSVSESKGGKRKRAQIAVPWPLLRSVMQQASTLLDDTGVPVEKKAATYIIPPSALNQMPN